MESDRELLELAAKAAGIGEIEQYAESGWIRNDTGETWNPLDDDGDAFRLACQLRIVTRVIGNKVSALGRTQIDEYIEGDVQRAARRAIVRAAAAIAKGSDHAY